MLELPAEVRDRYDTSALRTVVARGSAMPGAKVTAFLDRFGPVLYMLYGSTEVSWASIATPVELRCDPETAGRAPVGTVLRVLDDQDRVVPPGTTGRIFRRERHARRRLHPGARAPRRRRRPDRDGRSRSRDVVFLDELPRTSTRKVLKRTLRSRVPEPATVPEDPLRR